MKLVVACAVSFGAALAGSLLAAGSDVSGWYDNLEKPFFTPPGWLFGPVWTVLYLSMGVAAFLVWRRGLQSRAVQIALVWFLAQLVLNALWTPVFFGFHRLGWSVVVILSLWLAILGTIRHFRRVSKGASLLLCPYLLWVSFAAVLNVSIWLLNR
ncbi:MAG: tryptophan-rich sensory protein [Sedimentisphaerales bacterium]|nr:tryptophan-rich sensory protein [Sedimentisphaerales bacterium]